MKLNQLSNKPGHSKDRKRVGRGRSSGIGKTSGHGQKGQKSRSGVAIKGFEGGQMPIFRRVPKRGFVNLFRKAYRPINLADIQTLVDTKKIDATKLITNDVLQKAGFIKNAKTPVKLLANGDITSKVTIEVSKASQAAIKAVEKVGGSVKCMQDADSAS